MNLSFTIGICAYNEEKNIGRLLNNLIHQKLNKKFRLDKIEVIASGCTDRTEEITRNLAKKHKKIKLSVEEERRGKASAVNILIRNCNSSILILESADTLPAKGAINKMLIPFLDSNVGAVGVRPVPIDDWNHFTGFTVHMIWNLLHRMSEAGDVKLGELCAYRRKLIKEMPLESATDEAYLQGLVEKTSFKIVYEPKALVYNKGPSTLHDLIKQRRRIYYGHMQLRKNFGYITPTMKVDKIFYSLIFKATHEIYLKKIIFITLAVFLEAYCRFLAKIDFLRKKPYAKWEIVRTSKTKMVEDYDKTKF